MPVLRVHERVHDGGGTVGWAPLMTAVCDSESCVRVRWRVAPSQTAARAVKQQQLGELEVCVFVTVPCARVRITGSV